MPNLDSIVIGNIADSWDPSCLGFINPSSFTTTAIRELNRSCIVNVTEIPYNLDSKKFLDLDRIIDVVGLLVVFKCFISTIVMAII